MKISDFYDYKKTGRKFACITCYDYSTAIVLNQIGVESLLVGDSAAQVMLGHNSTLPAAMDFMVAITAAVKRGAPDKLIIADMPFLSYQISIEQALSNAGRFVVEAGADIVKIESGPSTIPTIKALSDAGIAVMAHIGIKPQSVGKFGKLKAEGTTADEAIELIYLADQMASAGAQMLLIEGTAREVAEIISKKSPLPVISCGSGPDCDAQVLVLHDVIGFSQSDAKPKFVKSYANVSDIIANAVSQYRDEVLTGQFPDNDHCYHIKKGELEKLLKSL